MQCNTMQLDSRDGSTHIASFLLFSPFPSLAYIMIIYIEQVTNSYIDIIPLTEVVKYHVATVALDVAQLADASGIKINTLSVRLDSSHSIFFFPRGFFAPLKREYIHIYVIHIPPFFLSFFFFSLSLSLRAPLSALPPRAPRRSRSTRHESWHRSTHLHPTG